MKDIIIIFAAFFAARLCSLAFSMRNEKRLIREGAVQYGKTNSLLLALTHTLYYAAALGEGIVRECEMDNIALAGIGIMAVAYAMLGYVIFCLRDVWTVKVYIAPHHRMERSWLFRTVRHPNYYLNIIPELIGVALLCHAWYTLSIGLPLYGLVLIKRIRIEEEAMKGMW